MTKRISTVVAAIAAGLLLPLLAFADVTVQFDNSGHATTTPGSTIIITGSVTNSGTQPVNALATMNVLPNGSTEQLAGAVTVDPASGSYLPATLSSGQVYHGSLVKLNIGATTTPADFTGYYYLVGSSTAATMTALGMGNFNLHIISGEASTTTPAATSTTETTATTTNFTGLQMPGLSGDQQVPAGLQVPVGSTAFAVSRLVKVEDNPAVYWVAENGLKVLIHSMKVLTSYGSTAEDIQSVSQEEFDSFGYARFIQLKGSAAIYKIADSGKQLISSPAWSESGASADEIVTVNLADFNSYKTGAVIKTASELAN